MKINVGTVQLQPAYLARLRKSVGEARNRVLLAHFGGRSVYQHLDDIEIVLNPRRVSYFGKATPSKGRIVLNAPLLADHPELLLETIVHEVAHLVADKLYGDPGHGRDWKRVMAKLGFEPKVRFDLAQLRRSRGTSQ